MDNFSFEKPLILFDGVCNLCNTSVQIIVRLDKDGRFLLASLQSDVGQALLRQHGMDTEQFDTVVMVDGDRLITHSDVTLRILDELGGGYRLVYWLLRAVPKPVRDVVYRWVARNRYRWFGRQESCMIPTPEIANRFVDASR